MSWRISYDKNPRKSTSSLLLSLLVKDLVNCNFDLSDSFIAEFKHRLSTLTNKRSKVQPKDVFRIEKPPADEYLTVHIWQYSLQGDKVRLLYIINK